MHFTSLQSNLFIYCMASSAWIAADLISLVGTFRDRLERDAQCTELWKLGN